LKIAIIGTRGVPNRYGGFEQFAEIVSQYWVEKGHEVICYNPHDHYFTEDYFNGVKIVKKFNPEKSVGAAANFLYDYLCLRDAVKRQCDIYLELGYQSASISFLTIPKKERKKIITNMDGLEWKRDKWSPLVKRITKFAEKIAVKYSARLISDNIGIANYYKENFSVDSDFIAYGCDTVEILDKSIYQEYIGGDIAFDLVIARLEPENSIETILNGVLKSSSDVPLFIVGNKDTKYGSYLQEKFKDTRVKFIGGIFNKNILDSMRQNCRLYFHGHTVGGTNPSLLEAMAAGGNIVAHNNEFNSSVLENDAKYFISDKEIQEIRDNFLEYENEFRVFNITNINKIKQAYSWNKIGDAYLEVFEGVVR
jgi:glycosyltransferase involved in cell wall biosynthesis